jgi:hypothetical protein
LVPGNGGGCGLNSVEKRFGQDKVAAGGASRGACGEGDRLVLGREGELTMGGPIANDDGTDERTLMLPRGG